MPVESANASHAAAFCNLYKWLQGNDFLSIKKNRQDPLIIMNPRKLASLLAQIPRQAIETSMDERKQTTQQETLPKISVTIDNPNVIASEVVKLQCRSKPSVAVNLGAALLGDCSPSFSREAQAVCVMR
jgi:hypothetical protein